MADREQPVTLRTRKFIRNPLLGRKQMVVYVHSAPPVLFSPPLFPYQEKQSNRLVPGISDVLHPSRPNVSKDELRSKLAELYKASKDTVSVFGFRTQYGGGKSTGFALIYDSNEVMKKFEPRYRLVRYGQATKIEKASRQQRTFFLFLVMVAAEGLGRRGRWGRLEVACGCMLMMFTNRETTQKPSEDCSGHGKDEGSGQEEEEVVRGLMLLLCWCW